MVVSERLDGRFIEGAALTFCFDLESRMLERATTLTAFSVPVLRQEHWYAVAKPPCSQPHPGQPPGFAAARWWCALCSARMRAWRRRTLPSIFPVR